MVSMMNVWENMVQKLMEIFYKIFDCLALASIFDGKIFCVRIGLSSSINLIDEIKNINKKLRNSSLWCNLWFIMEWSWSNY